MARYAELDDTGTVINVALSNPDTAAARGWTGPVPNYVGPGWTTSDGGQTWTSGTLPLPLTEQNRQTLQSRATAALTANSAYLAIASPTNAQVAAQVKTLTKECNAVIRLALGLLDSTQDT